MPRFTWHSLTLWGGVLGLLLLGCQTGELVALHMATATPSATVTLRPTFTPIRVIEPPSPLPPPPSLPPPVRAPTRRPVTPTRVPPRPRPTVTATGPPPPPPPPTATIDLYHGYYYRISKNTCSASENTRAEGTVWQNGMPQSGVKVRIANSNGGDPVIEDFVTGTDPNDYKHRDPAWAGKYRLGVAEGQRIDGNWWVFLVDPAGAQISVGAYFKTFNVPGCNVATIDFAHD